MTQDTVKNDPQTCRKHSYRTKQRITGRKCIPSIQQYEKDKQLAGIQAKDTSPQFMGEKLQMTNKHEKWLSRNEGKAH